MRDWVGGLDIGVKRLRVASIKKRGVSKGESYNDND